MTGSSTRALNFMPAWEASTSMAWVSRTLSLVPAGTVIVLGGVAGFGSAETLRRVFVSQLGISPKAYRDRFKSTGAVAS